MEDIRSFTPSETIVPFHTSVEFKIRHFPLKRIFDLLFSLFSLIMGAPVFLLIAFFIFITSPGRVIYSHERIGRGGKPFKCYKFRSMYVDSDKRLQLLLAKDQKLKKEWETTFKLKKDPRITPFGHFLRKTSLDELPQFWNVVKGDLSVVGPRPVVKEEIEKYYCLKAHKILSIRPGLTGPWQVSGRSNESYEERIRLDEYYVDHPSFMYDLKLIAKTIPAMLFAKGAY